MSSSFHGTIDLTVFGESHGPAVGMVLSGIEPGISIDLVEIEAEMLRRAPGRDLTSQRKESDTPIFLSGIYQGKTTGSPICAIFPNEDANSKGYDDLDLWMRPSHADFPAYVKYQGAADRRGGGHFSGRLTAPVVLAGCICEQAMRPYLSPAFGSHILKLGDYREEHWDIPSSDILMKNRQMDIPAEDPDRIRQIIEEIRDGSDSIGAMVETAACGIPAGLGDPFFDSMESRLSHLLFSIPGVKSVSFGLGDEFTSTRGSEANDPYLIEDGQVRTKTNNNGGILGGITNGMPIVFQTVFKPTASIGKEQTSVDMRDMTEKRKTIQGRHDPCIALRAIPVVEAALKIAVYDAFRQERSLHAGS